MVSSDIIHGKGNFPGKAFLQCIMNSDHYVGIDHRGKSYGSLANKDLRELRKKCHGIFDPLWRGENKRFSAREDAYVWLSKEMNMLKSRTHFGMFNEEMCEKAIKIITQFNEKN